MIDVQFHFDEKKEAENLQKFIINILTGTEEYENGILIVTKLSENKLPDKSEWIFDVTLVDAWVDKHYDIRGGMTEIFNRHVYLFENATKDVDTKE